MRYGGESAARPERLGARWRRAGVGLMIPVAWTCRCKSVDETARSHRPSTIPTPTAAHKENGYE